MPETSYASCGGLSLAYQVFGDGPVELVVVMPFVSHIELAWTLPQFKAFVEQLATFCRVLLFDKAGVGLSDPVPKVRTLDDRVAEIEAVMDAVGFTQAVVSGLSDGGPASMMFAAARPERVRALILCATYAFNPGEWDDMDRDPAELRASPKWARTTRRRLNSSPAGWKPAAPCAPAGAAVRQPASARRRSGRYASSQCWSA
jgi:pimeloyl-ACP methyl ester carboxylesterase